MMKKVSIILFFAANIATTSVFAAQLPKISVSVCRDTVTSDSVRLMDFVGQYKFKELPLAVHVSVKENGKLHLEGADRVLDVPPMKDRLDSFEIPEAVLTFVRNHKNEVIRLKVTAGDEVFEGEKVSK